MGRFQGRYAARQREAVGQARNERGMTGPEVAEAAAAGTLADDLEPFEIPVQTVYDIAKEERQVSEAVATGEAEVPSQGFEAVEQRIVRLLDREIAHWEAQPPGQVEIFRLQQLAAAAQRVVNLSTAVQRTRGKSAAKSNGHTATEQQPPPESDLMKRMREAATRRA